MKEIRNQGAFEDGGARQEQIPEFRRVLAATDGSEFSNRAVAYAYSVLCSGGVVCILHVEQPFEFANPVHAAHVVGAQRLEAERVLQLEASRARLRALIPSEADARGIITEIEVLHENKPAHAICLAAAAFGADLICMASHGRSGLSKTILGSVAQTVMSQSKIPVLVVFPRRT